MRISYAGPPAKPENRQTRGDNRSMPYTQEGRAGEHAADRGIRGTSAALSFASRGRERLQQAELARHGPDQREQASRDAHQAAADLQEAAKYSRSAAAEYDKAAKAAHRAGRTLSRPQ